MEEEELAGAGSTTFKHHHNDSNELKRLLTCYHSSVVLSTGDMLDATVTKVLQWFWQINLEQKCSMAQLTVLTPAECVHSLLCKTDTMK